MYYNDKPQAKNIHHLHELERVSKPGEENELSNEVFAKL